MVEVDRFRVILAEKEPREKRHIPLSEVERDTDISWKTLQGWAINKVARYDAPVIEALCKYFECEVGDLIVNQRE